MNRPRLWMQTATDAQSYSGGLIPSIEHSFTENVTRVSKEEEDEQLHSAGSRGPRASARRAAACSRRRLVLGSSALRSLFWRLYVSCTGCGRLHRWALYETCCRGRLRKDAICSEASLF